MDYRDAQRFLWNKGILSKKRNPIYGFSRVRIHNRFESLEHFMAKAMMSFLIFKQGDGLITEADCKNGRVLDILQIKGKDSFISYEMESNKNNKSDVEGVDIMEIPLKNMPKSSKNGLKMMEKWLRRYLV